MSDKKNDKVLEIRECYVSEKTNIVQSNYLIERKQKLSLPATQLLFTLTGMINKEDANLKEYHVSVQQFVKLWNADEKKAYETVAKSLEELRIKGINNHSINPKTGKKVFETIGFISYGRYEEGKGYATMTIDPRLKEHYIELKKNFTQYTLGNLLRLQEADAQVNTMRTYELLKQYEKIGSRKMTVKEYKDFLGLITYSDNKRLKIKREKYKGSNANLKTYVLEPAKEKINDCTDIVVDYKITGRGLNAKIEFTIVKNPKHKISQLSPASEYSTDVFLKNIEIEELFEKEYYVQSIDDDGRMLTFHLTKDYIATQTGDIYIFTKEQEAEEAPAYFIPNKKINCDEINAYFQSLGSSPALPDDEVVDVADTNEFNPVQEIDMSEILNEASPFEMEVMDELPEDVHDYMIENIRAIIHIAEEYISTEYTDFVDFESDNGLSNAQRIQEACEYAASERQRLIVMAIKSYIIQDFNRRKKGINADKHIGYFQAGFRGWLEKRKEYENR